MSLLLPIIIVAQIIFSAFVLKTSPTNIVPYKDHVKNVLGVKIAQDIAPTNSNPPTTPEPQPPSNSEPAPETSPEASPAPSETTPQANPINQPEASPQPQQETTTSSSDQSQPQGPNPTSGNSPADTDQQINSLNQIFEVSPTPQPTGEQASPSPSSQVEPSQEQQATISQNMAVLNPEELTSSSESINPQAVDEVKKEEEVLDKINDPQKQTAQLLINSVDKIKDINQQIIKDDFASTNFASQRFNDQIDRALENINSLPKAQAQKLRVQLTKLCNQADLVLRNAELSVPEDLEQDLEINRSRCLSF